VGITLFFALSAIALALWYCVQRGGSAHVLTLAPALLVSVVLLQSDSGGTSSAAAWRVTLAGLQFQLAPGQSIRFGGDPRADHVFVRGMPPGLLRLQRTPSGALALEQSPPEGGVVIIRDVEAPVTDAVDPAAASSDAPASAYEAQWGGIAIAPGRKFCRSDRAECSAVSLSWSLRGEQAVLHDAAERELCALPMNSKGRSAERGGELRIYTLADYARAQCSADVPFAWSKSQPAEEFLYWRDAQLYLFPAAGAKYAIGRAEGGFELRSARLHTLADGEQRDVYFHRYVRQDSSAAVPGSASVGRIRDIRSFRVRHVAPEQARDSTVEVFLHTPESTRVSLGPEALLTITSKVANPATLAEGAAMAGFEVIGAPAAAELLNVLKLESGSRQFEGWAGQGQGCFDGAATLTIRGMSRLDCAPAGRWFAIGDAQYLQAKVRVASLQVPSTWLAAIWTLVLANLLIRAALGLSLPVRVVLVCLESLLALRLLIACDAALVDAKQEGTVAAAWLALLCLPAAFELTVRSGAAMLYAGAARVARLLLLAAGVGLLATSLGFSDGAALRAVFAQDVGVVLLVAVTLGVALLLLLRVAGPAVHWLGASFSDWTTPRAAALMLVALAAVHSALALAGVREQIGGLRVSTLLVPLLVLAWGNWYVRMARPAATWTEVARALGAAFLPLVGFILARDNGAYVYFLGLAAGLLPLAWPWLKQHWMSALLAGLLLSAVLLAGFALLDTSFSTLFAVALVAAVVAAAGLYVLQRGGRLGLQPLAAWALPAGFAVAGVLALHLSSALLNADTQVRAATPVTASELERIVGIEGNSIRLLDLIAPRTVEGLGLRQGYEQRAAMSEMFSYGATLTGRGWPSSAAPRELRVTHVDDAVTAVHVLAPFGRITALGLAGLLVAFALGSASWLRARPDISPDIAPDAGRAAASESVFAQQARLALAVLLTVSLYMLFANIGVVPFTGRNFYFLSVASNSDLLEGGLLLVIIAAGLVGRVEPAPTVPVRLEPIPLEPGPSEPVRLEPVRLEPVLLEPGPRAPVQP